MADVIIEPLARLVMPGKQDIGLGATILAGAVGALVGGAIAQLLELDDTNGADWITLFLQIVSAAVA